jgi:hypothetical protein
MLFCFCFYSSRHFSNINKKKKKIKDQHSKHKRALSVFATHRCVCVCVWGGDGFCSVVHPISLIV